MGKTFWHYPIIMAGGAFAVVTVLYVFNLWIFSVIPSLQGLVSPNDALFLEGLLVLILGAMILLRLPHAEIVGGRRKIFLGSVLTKDVESHGSAAGSILAFGLAFIIAALLLFLMSFWGIY